MASITVITRDGQSHTLTATPGMSVMEIIKDAGISELLALCGGCCSCATCHVHVAEGDMARTGPAGADEADLLDSSENNRPNSRLSCQIPFTPALDGLTVTIAPED
ncbi:2Fe-2S iron-sulfur cluster-binding protein [Sandarakinorhabdus rubra]|uniref:2Fe-2S iron-sulfur cluster-binding protein n=1 Tax=Sandarakinorhabdus rubra TaxID=2672568 RepID=UPI0013DD5D61|nr:2Fe-2S iron-sulfur cluster-binding protein [Sandarakinorhabdus rubra]